MFNTVLRSSDGLFGLWVDGGARAFLEQQNQDSGVENNLTPVIHLAVPDGLQLPEGVLHRCPAALLMGLPKAPYNLV